MSTEEPGRDFEALAKDRARASLLADLRDYLRETGKWWLAPVLAVLLILGLLLLFGGGPGGPFIYALF